MMITSYKSSIRGMMLFAALLYMLCIFANPVDQNNARQRAMDFIRKRQMSTVNSSAQDGNRARSYNQSVTLKLVYADNGKANEAPLFYVFNIGNNGLKGFVIVSGDDCMPAILGYSDSDIFEVSNLPPAVSWWLSEYEGMKLSSGRYQANKRTAISLSIEPLLTSKWRQGDPYNRCCPIGNDGQHCVTGCGPTALSQIMYYHKWPKRGNGRNSYECDIDGVGKQILTADFGQTYYNWESMRDVENITDATDATATLMYHAGVAMEVQYGIGGSSLICKNEAKVLKNYFGYKAENIEASSLSSDDFTDILLSELSQGRPVYYAGGNHAFVLDGYKDGYYHFNWGWGGKYDGYYLMSEMKPGGMDFTTKHRICIAEPNKDYVTSSVELEKAGTLRDEIGAANIEGIKTLKVKGKLNGTDFLTLREMAGRDIDYKKTNGQLVELDLSEAEIVNGGDCYFVSTNPKYYETQNGTKANIFPAEAFMGTNLKSISLPEKIQEVDKYAFLFCYELKNISFGVGVKQLDFSCFNYTSMSEIVVPDQVTSIGPYAFCNMSSLKRVKFGRGVRSIGHLAFTEDKNIEEIESEIAVPFGINDNVFSEECYQNAVLRVPYGQSSIYKTQKGWKNFKNIVEGMTESVESTDSNVNVIDDIEIHDINGLLLRRLKKCEMGSEYEDALDGLGKGIYIIHDKNGIHKFISHK